MTHLKSQKKDQAILIIEENSPQTMGYFFLLRDLFPLHTLFATDTVVFFRCTQNYGPSQKIVLDASPGASGQASQNAIEIQQVQSSSLPTAERQRLHRGAFFFRAHSGNTDS